MNITTSKSAEDGRGLNAVINGKKEEKREEIVVAEAILAVTQALVGVPPQQIENVFTSVKAIFSTARGEEKQEKVGRFGL